MFGKNLRKLNKAIRDGDLIKKSIKVLYTWFMQKVALLMKNHWDKSIAVEKNKILFLTFQLSYTCNPKYICEEILRRKLPYKLVWVKDIFSQESFPTEVEVVQVYSLKYFHALYSSAVWIDNAFNATKTIVAKRNNQFYLETMHGSLGIKKIDSGSVKDKKRNSRGTECGSLVDVCISNSTFETGVYRSSFWADSKIWLMGHARNDILFETKEETINTIRQRVYKELKIPAYAKLILYAPTFRSYSVKNRLDADKLIDFLEKNTGEEWRILERAHKKSSDEERIINNKGKIINAFPYDDIQELMLVADMGITDYSSWIFDYMLTRKPGFLFAPDLERYTDSRGFYYPIETTPFPIARNTDELLENIRSFNRQSYCEKIEDFLKEKGCMEDGHAAERIVDELEKIIYSAQFG